MTLEQADRGYSPFPTFWCSKHKPSDYEYLAAKIPLELEAMRLFKEAKYRKIFCKQVFEALGIAEGTRITEVYAHHFFENLRIRQKSSSTDM
jgi:hypothetical protein